MYIYMYIHIHIPHGSFPSYKGRRGGREGGRGGGEGGGGEEGEGRRGEGGRGRGGREGGREGGGGGREGGGRGGREGGREGRERGLASVVLSLTFLSSPFTSCSQLHVNPEQRAAILRVLGQVHTLMTLLMRTLKGKNSSRYVHTDVNCYL